MVTIHKFELASQVEMPEGASLLSVQVQREKVVAWAVVDTEAPKKTRRFLVAATGAELPPDVLQRAVHLATLQTDGGMLVHHVFEVTEGVIN